MRYVANTATSQIHDRHAAGERCNLDDATHTDDIGLKDMLELIRKGGFDLCDWCFADDRFGTWTVSPLNETADSAKRNST